MKKSIASTCHNKLYYCVKCNRTIFNKVNVQRYIKFKNLEIQLNPFEMIIATVIKEDDLNIGLESKFFLEDDKNYMLNCKYCNSNLGKIISYFAENITEKIRIWIINLKNFIVKDFKLLRVYCPEKSLKVDNLQKITSIQCTDLLKKRLTHVYNSTTNKCVKDRIIKCFEKLFNFKKQVELLAILDQTNQFIKHENNFSINQ